MREGIFARAERFGVGASGVIATISVLCMLILSILTALDVGLRTWASSPIAWFNEIVEQVLAVAIAGCFSASIAQRRDLVLDVMTTFFGERRAHWFRI